MRLSDPATIIKKAYEYILSKPELHINDTAPEIICEALFPQIWSSTALGFDGIGGQAITTAYTVILEVDGDYYVFFSGAFAYRVSGTSAELEIFFMDMYSREMVRVSMAPKRYPVK